MAASEIEKLERLVRENPKGRLFASLADAYRKDGQYQRALDVLEAGLQNHPDYVSARVVLGRVHMAMGDNAKAREAFARVVELDPESVIALKALADLAEQDGSAQEAVRWSSQLLTVDPGNDEAQKQMERLQAAAPAEAPAEAAPAAPEEPVAEVLPEAPAAAPRASLGLSSLELIVPPEEPAMEPPPPPPPAASEERTVPTPFAPPMVAGGAPAFIAAEEPLAQEPEPLPVERISDEAQTEAIAAQVSPMDALEPTSFEGPSAAVPTERLAGLDLGMSEDEAAAIPAASGFEPTAGPLDVTDAPRTSVIGLESISGEPAAPEPEPEPLRLSEPEPQPEAAQEPEPEPVPVPAAPLDFVSVPGEDELEREQDIELSGAGTNEFQEASAAEMLQARLSGPNQFQVPSDAETLGMGQEEAAPPPAVAEEPEPAVAEPEPVFTEAMAELYASQGHLVQALEVYRELMARDPDGGRFAARVVELEMFVGGAPAAAAASGVTVGEWLAGVLSARLPSGASAPLPVAEAPAPEPLPEPVAEAAPEPPPAPASPGAPTRPASGSFSLNNVFGEGGAPAGGKPGSFDDFFGAPPPAAAPAPTEPPASRTTRPSNTPPSPDDLSSFQDWLKGLKQ